MERLDAALLREVLEFASTRDLARVAQTCSWLHAAVAGGDAAAEEEAASSSSSSPETSASCGSAPERTTLTRQCQRRKGRGMELFWEEVFEREFVPKGFRRTFSPARRKDECSKCAMLASPSLGHVTLTQPAWTRVARCAESVPAARQGASMAATSDRRGALLVGGWTTHGIVVDAHFFSLESRSWRPLRIKTFDGHLPTYGHALTAVEPSQGLDRFLVTGGACSRRLPGRLCTDRDSPVGQAERGTSPDRAGLWRAYHTAVTVFGKHVFLFGGFNDDGPLSCLEYYNLDKKGFLPIPESGAEPCARFGHTSTVVRQDKDRAIILVLGGTRACNNLKIQSHPYDLELNDAYLLTVGKNVACGVRWSRIESHLPWRRVQRCHSAVALGEWSGNLIIFGGGAPGLTINCLGKVCLSEIRSCQELTWEYLRPATTDAADELDDESMLSGRLISPVLPFPRQNHCAVLLGNDTMMVFGGCMAQPLHAEELDDTWLLEFGK
ncbi:Hypothetical protein (Fragment) [Durusdinium trenchii]|uniref:F-box domain-containing protein n=1 Tax=Durusdinium trenchii TaxID=1381693 RepID=A0ABP0JYI4_9DINO